MARDYNINISVNGSDTRGAFQGGNLYKSRGTLNSGNYAKGKDVSSNNLKKIVSVGMLFNKSQQANEIIGAYTNDRLRQRRIDVGMTFAKYGIGIAVNAPLGLIYAGGDLAYRGIMYGIRVQKGNREAEYYRKLSGNNAFSGSVYRGDYV